MKNLNLSELAELRLNMDSITSVLKSFSAGEIVLVIDDDPLREGGETDFVVSASKITPEQVSFLAHKGGGLICVAMAPSLLDRLQIPLMNSTSSDPQQTGWCMSVDYKDTGSGISAPARACTIAALANPQSMGKDFTRPGHVFPLRARAGGLRERRGHTEAAVALCELTQLPLAAGICELMMPDGHMATPQQAVAFAQANKIHVCTIAQIEKIWLNTTTNL